MTPTKIPFSSSYEDYLIEVENYILTLREPIAKNIKRIEKSMRIFTEKIYGYLPTAGEIKWPVLEPNYNVDVTRLVPFHEAYSYDITDAVIYFYIDDSLFIRIFANPDKYKIIELKDSKTPTKMPEESHSPNAIYGMMFKKGNGLKSISIYDSDCKKVIEIHNEDHDGLGPHYHYWKNGRPIGEPQPIASNPQYQQLLNETISLL